MAVDGDGTAAPADPTPHQKARRRPTTVAQSLAAKTNQGIDKAIGLYQVDASKVGTGGRKPVLPVPVSGSKRGKAATAAAETGIGTGSWVTDWLHGCFFRRRADEDVDGTEPPTPDKPKVSFLALLSYSTTQEKWLMAFGLVMAAISGLAVPTWLILLANGLNKFSNLGFLINAGVNLMDVVQEELNKLVIAFAILGAVSLVAGSLYVSIWTYTGEKQALRIKEKFVKSAFHQDAEWFDENSRDELPTKVANAMVHITSAIGRQIADLFSNMWASAGCLAVAFVLNAPLALVMLCIVPVVVVCIAIISCFIRKASKKSADSFSSAGALATEVLAGIKTIAALCAEPWAIRTYSRDVETAQHSSVWGGFLTALSTGTTSLLFYITYTVAFFLGTYLVSQNSSMVQFFVCLIGPWITDIEIPPWWGAIGGIIGGITGDDDSSSTNSTDANSTDITIGDIVAGVGAIQDMYDPDKCRINGASVMCCIYGVILCATFFGLMAPALQAINLGRQAAVEIFDTIKHVPNIDPSTGEGVTPEKLEGEVTFDGVYFSYPTRPKDILYKDFSLVAEAGKSLAIVGPSGCGKSTIARLILRFYDPIDGCVRVDGTPLAELNLEWWRQNIGYVAQEPVMFPGTLYENIALGKSESGTVTREEVIAASKAACCDSFIKELPDGYDTFYSGASIQLSGGQMQRICIARAMIRNPSILLLDEATSALDTNSERQVQAAVENIRKTKKITTITVAHRLSTIVNSDSIAVISDGCIAEQGTHKELLALDGIYTTLCESQGITAESTFEENLPGDPIGGSVKYSVRASMMKSMIKSLATKEGGMLEEDDVEAAKADIGEEGEEDKDSEEQKLASKSRLWELNKPEWGYAAMGGIGSCMVGALPPCEGILTAQIVANFYEVAPDQMMASNAIYILNFLTLGAGALIGNIMSGCGFSVSGYRLTRRMREKVFEAMVRRDMGWFDFPEHSTGELTTRLETDAEMVAKVTGWALGYRVRVIATLIAGLTIALVFAWQVGLVTLLCVPLIMGAAIIQKCCMSRQFVKDNGPNSVSAPTLLEQGLRGIASVQAYGLEDKMCNDYTVALIPESNGKVKMGAVAGFVFGFSQFAVFATFAVLFYVGSMLLVQAKIDFVSFFTAVLAVMFGALGISQVTVDFNAQEEGLAAAQRIFDIIDEPYNDMDPLRAEGDKPSSIEGAISFKDVTFSYPSRPNHLVYKPSADGKRPGFSLEVAPKQSVAFVGKSGCGKSTALQLFLKFYEPNSGFVRLDGKDVRELNTKWLRENVGYVGQMPVLFAGTVRDNILMGKPGATDEEVQKAAKEANIHDTIMSLNLQYDTDIGSGGMLLSGGQRQRVAIARAIISQPKILVLDEATAALDNESERIVQAALDDMQQKSPRTTLVVAHRLGTVKNCDQIAVLDKGGVAELGTHDELLEKKGLYHELWMKQGGGGDD